MTQSLDSLLECYQHLRHIGEIVLIGGLVGDFLAVAFLHNRQRLERIGTLIATAGVILGVALESWAGGKADDVVRRMRAPRSLTQSQQTAIGGALKSFGTHEAVFYEVSDVDPEIAGITADLSKSCAFAGWKSGFESFPPTPQMWLRAPARGILVLVSPAAPDRTVLPAAQALMSMLRSDGLDVGLSQAFVGPQPPADDRVRIIVYVK